MHVRYAQFSYFLVDLWIFHDLKLIVYNCLMIKFNSLLAVIIDLVEENENINK